MNYELIITDLFCKLGICKYYIGIDYITYAMELIDTDKQYLYYVTKSLYIDIAKEFNTTPTCIEKNIRTLINRIWKYAYKCSNIIVEVFGDKFLYVKPSNKEFLQRIYYHVKRQEKFLSENKLCPYCNVKCVLFK